MASSTDLILSRLATIPDVSQQTAIFVRMDGPLAIVNIGDRSVSIPCSGFYPPLAGMIVQVERRNGRLLLTGPAVPLDPMGVMVSAGTPKALVNSGGVEYLLGLRAGYSPVVGDAVEINWSTAIIQGKVTVAAVPADTTANPPAAAGPLSPDPVFAEGSGSYQGRWWMNDVWASNNNDGAWFYGGRIQSALAGASMAKIEIYLPLMSQIGNVQIGVHSSGSQPGGPVAASMLTALGNRSGWVELPLAFANYLRDNAGGIFVQGGSGSNRWKGTQKDSLSGALRFQGTR